jgi:hypothetical protein
LAARPEGEREKERSKRKADVGVRRRGSRSVGVVVAIVPGTSRAHSLRARLERRTKSCGRREQREEGGGGSGGEGGDDGEVGLGWHQLASAGLSWPQLGSVGFSWVQSGSVGQSGGGGSGG